MTHMKMSLFDYIREDPAFPFTNTNFMIKVVAVHDGEGIKKVSNGQIINWLFRKLSLG
jgi:hypothetical protein